jgi:hypothetical protein
LRLVPSKKFKGYVSPFPHLMMETNPLFETFSFQDLRIPEKGYYRIPLILNIIILFTRDKYSGSSIYLLG